MGSQSNVNGQAKVTIDKNGLKAYLEVTSPSGEGIPCDIDQVRKVLEENQVVYGLREDFVKQALMQRNHGIRILVAEGKAPIDGTIARLIYKFPLPNERFGPRIDDKGTADYHDLGLIYNVTIGQLLMEKIPATEGTPGIDVRGNPIEPKKGRDILLPRGKNTVTDEEGKYLYAVTDGHVTIRDGKVVVEPVFQHSGDVDFSSGDIDFVGNVIINGNINSGFKVKAGGDIEVKGFIEDAEVIAGGSILVTGGITGAVKGIIKAQCNIGARFVENSRLEAGGDILIREAIMQSMVKAGGNIRVKDKRAIIVGGTLQASEEIESRVLGSQLATQTIIEVGVNPYYRDEYQRLVKTRTEKKSLVDKINHNLQIYQRSGIAPDSLSERKKLALIKMLDDFKTLRQELTQVEERIAFIENEFQRINHARVKADIVYPGVRITIGQAIYIVNDPIKYSAFLLDEGEVKLAPLT